MAGNELDIRKQEALMGSLNLADSVVYKTYLSSLNQLEVVPCPVEIKNSDLNDFVRFFKVERFIYEKNENIRDKLISVFHSVASCGGSIIVLIDSDGEKIDYYFGTKVPLDTDVSPGANVLLKSLEGNFPGTKISKITGGSALEKLRRSVFKNQKHTDQLKQVCTITGVAGIRGKEENNEKLFVQGMEKLIDSMRGETYSLLPIADPVNSSEMQIIKRGYENLYSQLVPFAGSELNFGQNESSSVSDSVTEGLSKSINKSVTDTLAHTEGTSDSHTEGSSDSVGVYAGVMIPPFGGGVNYSHGWNRSDTHSSNQSDTDSHAIMEGSSIAASKIEGKTNTKGEGTSRNIQLKFENKAVKNLLEKIDLQLKRLDASADTGMWNCSVYCLADNAAACKIVASSYQSLLRGENSSLETASITEWNEPHTTALLPWLEKMHHPQLLLKQTKIMPTSFLSSAELTIHAGIPQSSVSGLPVLEMAAFGREVSTHWENDSTKTYGDKIALGNIFHMGKRENTPVILSKHSLASHTFITGSTGSGKSNTVYQLLNEIKKSGSSFLVVEPAKGEYKNVFGNNSDVSVYGTNPALTPLLRINPFRFPHDNKDASKNIHILEHLDRLVEIFNVCWSMYDAMPAILKSAVEKSYEEAGWDLQKSENSHNATLYPSFIDVVKNIKRILDNSEYSNEIKDNYKGALVTRLTSLTNGINGMIFTNDDVSGEDLFDRNVIVDLSRVGSAETKALIMGLLVMKLQEFRMTSGRMNSDLQHVTVLEEAHTLLKRTSTAQSDESSNLLGKSVEMLANAIAEMRTYGEGFIIADQSPGLLDMSVIRNTNTKIILRLPDEGDRTLVGKAAGLNDEQIVELAKLQCGVAAVYQNNWIQPVLCKIREYNDFDKTYNYQNPDTASLEKINSLAKLTRLARTGEKINNLKEIIEEIDFATFKTLKPETIVALFPKNREVCAGAITEGRTKQDLYDYLLEHIQPGLIEFDSEYRNHILKCIVSENCKYHPNDRDFPAEWEKFVDNIIGNKEGHLV